MVGLILNIIYRIACYYVYDSFSFCVICFLAASKAIINQGYFLLRAHVCVRGAPFFEFVILLLKPETYMLHSLLNISPFHEFL